MELLLGPVLYAEAHEDANEWRFSVNLLLAGGPPVSPPPLRLCFRDTAAAPDSPEVGTVRPPEVAGDFSALGPDAACVWWRWRVCIPRAAGPLRLAYRFEPTPPGLPWHLDEVRDVVVPARGALPHCAFFSCNGVSEEWMWSRLGDAYALWEDMARQHREGEGFHLLLGGGDQLYADSLFHTHPALRAFQRLRQAERLAARPSEGFPLEMVRAYVQLYCERWREPRGIAPMLARVPGLFTWDDHDILDGWGSHEQLQQAPYFQAVYHGAAVAFEAFQLGALRQPADVLRQPGASHYLQAVRFAGETCDVDFVLLDLRSGRTVRPLPGGKSEHTVLSEAQWAALEAWRHQYAERSRREARARHVVVVSSVPLVFMRFGASVEWLAGAKGLRDDLLDQWESRVHRGERARMLTHLFELGREARCAVTVVSGDSHVGAHGLVRSQSPRHLLPGQPQALIEQVTSSGIVHPVPSSFELQGMKLLARESREDLPGSMQTELLPVGDELYLHERNWLSFWVAEGAGRSAPKLWLQWEAEHSHIPMSVVVEPPPPG